ncbi:MAG: hypothetical protein AAGA48_18645 [Myxococcota bacterium]
MSQWVAWGWVVGCLLGGGERRAPTTVTCPEGATLRTTEPAETLDTREGTDTQVLQCLDASGGLVGPQLERYPDEGAVAVEGTWEQGLRHGTWTVWRPDGAFVRQAHYDGGVPTDEWLEVTADGRITGVTFDAGVVVGLRSLPVDTEMPEWDQGIAMPGRRYQGQGS